MERPFKLYVDTSDIGARAVLLQDDGIGVEHPVSFYAKKFNTFQLNYFKGLRKGDPCAHLGTAAF